jgi:hypothetical protein
MYEVKVAGECPPLYSRYKGIDTGRMVKCDVGHLASQMRYVYTHQADAIQKGKLASEYVKRYNWEKTASLLKKHIDEFWVKEVSQKNIKNLLPLEGVK